LAQPNADQLLPQVIFIERGSNSGLDEHPDTGTNIQKGAAEVSSIINALLKSPAWATSAMIFTYDEGGGLYDHVPPFPEVEPDSVQPMLAQAQQSKKFKFACAAFNESGFRLPMAVISPWVRPNFVSHVNRDNTAILKFIETRFNLPSLTARDAAQDNMLEFFDFSSPHLLTPPPLPAQPTNGTANVSLETAP
jgi:phospholipase C